ncbi:phage portal protein [Flavobacterium sp. CSZ]|uniref:phage portal protein n=1 Tax=Flavobacterium sp. CSZ TaxID=2783791 RepID=UPI001889F300|nr:phage portal protein [Flavobacterium sp. CSZ]MBF4484424.1 phage portal protein [Flavobacterium sp. CSZ]
MGFNGAFREMFTPQKRSSSTDGSYFGNYGGFFSLGSSSVYGMKPKTALKLSAFYNGVDQISNDIAKIPFAIYQKDGSNRLSRPDHPANILISTAPNYLMTSFVFRKTMAISYLIRGNALAKIKYNASGYPVSTDFINWDLVKDIRLKKGELLYDVRGYDKPLLASEVLHFKNFSHNGIVGVGVITYAAQQLGMALEVQQFSATNFENKGVRQGVIQTDKTIEKGKDKIIAGWKTAMGEKSPDRIVVLDDGFKFQPINITPQEAQIIEQQKFNIEDIARWLNIAPHKIKSLEQSTNNNIEQQSMDHNSDTIQPHITNFEQEYAKKLCTPSELKDGYFVRANMDVLLRTDIKSRSEAYARAVLGGWRNRNEIRELEDLNAGPEILDEYLTPVNTFTESQIDKKLKEDGK